MRVYRPPQDRGLCPGMFLAGSDEGVIWAADMQEPTVHHHEPCRVAQGDGGLGPPSLYQGFVMTPHSFALDRSSSGEWSVGVFLRTMHQDVGQNRYFRLRGVLAKTEPEALQLGVRFGRYLIDREVVAALEGEPEAEVAFRVP